MISHYFLSLNLPKMVPSLIWIELSPHFARLTSTNCGTHECDIVFFVLFFSEETENRFLPTLPLKALSHHI